MRIILALAAVAGLVACSHNNPDTQPGPETGQVTSDTTPTRTPSGAVDTAAAHPRTGTMDTSAVRPNANTPPPTSTAPPPTSTTVEKIPSTDTTATMRRDSM